MRLPKHVRERKWKDGTVRYEFRAQLHGKLFKRNLGKNPSDLKRLARLAEDEYRAALRKYESNPQGLMTVSEFAHEEWLPRFIRRNRGKTPERKESAERQAARYFEEYAAPFIGNMPIGEVARRHLQPIYDRVMELDRAQATKRHIMVDIQTLFSWACELDVIDANPFTGKKLVPKVERGLPKPLAPETVERLLDVLEQPHLDCFRFALATGLRWGEQRRLQLSCVDLENKQIHLENTKHSWRVIPMSGDALEIAVGWVTEAKKNGTEEVHPWRAKHATALPKWTLKHYGIKWNWHQLRHTFACDWLAMDGSMEALQQILGHASMATTAIYGRVHQDRLKKEMRKTDRARARVGPEVGRGKRVEI